MLREQRIRMAVNLGPTDDWEQLLGGARLADELGLDAIGVLDHYHTERPDWGWLSGWAMWGALAMQTSTVRLVPMVIDRLNHLPGVLAKEVSVLSRLSGGRFELGIGAGDFFAEQRAWGLPVPNPSERINGLAETVTALQQIWHGEPVSTDGDQVRLTDARCLPTPLQPPRVVVGAGGSRRLITSAVDYADELNVYADDDVITAARAAIDASGRQVALSVYVWDWPDRLDDRLAVWSDLGVDRVFLTVWPPYDVITEIAAHQLG
ncbi:LLM class flavin-dependent oxidoreductase [Microlunatus elymi]|uniref:LLM class flavin-dependent oxidoreductase n=1 Tax=Microlunatus elymi TaxID=2596828 RepID=A0A516Q1P9_9ACTN|nr:LLM class flavin-dependent oxidoreductase [Microlunatus elymi]QDP97357.1 LLM class flavin-dependent oxidoreductase [Microlunatus elymi]